VDGRSSRAGSWVRCYRVTEVRRGRNEPATARLSGDTEVHILSGAQALAGVAIEDALACFMGTTKEALRARYAGCLCRRRG